MNNYNLSYVISCCLLIEDSVSFFALIIVLYSIVSLLCYTIILFDAASVYLVLRFWDSCVMSQSDISKELNELLNSENGCEYTDLEDSKMDYVLLGKANMLNILHINVRSYMKNVDNLILLLN